MHTETNSETKKENIYVGRIVAWAFGIIGILMTTGIIQLVSSLNSINETLSRLDERYIGQQSAMVELRSLISDKYSRTEAKSDILNRQKDVDMIKADVIELKAYHRGFK